MKTEIGLNFDELLSWQKIYLHQMKGDITQAHIVVLAFGIKSKLPLSNKLLLYKTTLNPVWTYGLQLWGCGKTTSLEDIAKFQSKVVRPLADVSW